MSSPKAVDTSTLLAELFEHYDKSCIVLAELERSLKDRDGLMSGPVGLGPAKPPAAILDDEDLKKYEEVDEFVEDALDCPSEPRSQTMGLTQLAQLQPEAGAVDGDDDVSLPTRGASIIDMSVVAPNLRRLPRRAASLYSLGSARLQPSLSLNRRAPPDAARQQQQQLRLGNEHVARARPPGGGAESPKSPLPPSSSSSTLPDLLVHQLRGAPQQVLQPYDSPRLAHALHQKDFLGSSAPTELPSAATAQQQQQQPQPPLAQAPSGDGFSRHRSLPRRASCYVFSPLGGSSFNAPQQHQPQPQPQQQGLGSPAARSAASACASPVPVPLAAPASPALPPAGGAYGSEVPRRSSSNAQLLALRPTSRSHGQPGWVTMDCLPDGGGAAAATAAAAAAPVADIPTSAEPGFPAKVQEGETFAEGAVGGATCFPPGSSSPAAAGPLPLAASPPGGGGSPLLRVTGGTLPPVRLRAPPTRARSYSIYGSGTQDQASWPLSNAVRAGAAAAAAAAHSGGTANG